MTKIVLTAKQLEHLENLGNEKKAAQMTLDRALRFHSNHVEELNKEEQAWWKETMAIHGLSTSKEWKTAKVDGMVCIVEKDYDEE